MKFCVFLTPMTSIICPYCIFKLWDLAARLKNTFKRDKTCFMSICKLSWIFNPRTIWRINLLINCYSSESNISFRCNRNPDTSTMTINFCLPVQFPFNWISEIVSRSLYYWNHFNCLRSWEYHACQLSTFSQLFNGFVHVTFHKCIIIIIFFGNIRKTIIRLYISKRKNFLLLYLLLYLNFFSKVFLICKQVPIIRDFLSFFIFKRDYLSFFIFKRDYLSFFIFKRDFLSFFIFKKGFKREFLSFLVFRLCKNIRNF